MRPARLPIPPSGHQISLKWCANVGIIFYPAKFFTTFFNFPNILSSRSCPTRLFLCCDKGSSTSANELSRQWAVRLSTAHRREIRRALYLTPSDNKAACSQNAHLRLVNCAFPACEQLQNSSCYTTSVNRVVSTYLLVIPRVMESLCNASLMGGDGWRCAYGGGRCFLLIATISAVLMLSMVFILLRGAMSRAWVSARQH